MKNIELIEFCRERGVLVSAYGPQGGINSSAEQTRESVIKRLSKNLQVADDGKPVSLGKVIKFAMAAAKEVKAEDVARAFFHLSCSLKTTACIITVDGGNIEASLR